MVSTVSNDHDGPLRDRLVDVGVQLVTAEGAGSLGLREIARRAGVSHGAPRRYFPTHQSLLSAIARRGFGDLQTRLTAATERAPSARGQLLALARAYVAYALTHRGMFELMFRHDLLNGEGQETGRPEEPPAGRGDGPQLREVTLPLFAHLTGLVAQDRAERPAAAGAAPGAPGATAAALWSNLHGIAQLWTWGSLQLVLGEGGPAQQPPHAPDDPAAPEALPASLATLITATLDAHLGPDLP